MKLKKYLYPQFSIEKDSALFSIKVNDYKNVTPEQINIFSLMVNFGYNSISSDLLYFTDEQIVDFWNYSKDSVLKNIKLNQYYRDLGISPVFDAKIPTLKIKGAFFSNQYELIVTWVNDPSKDKIAALPQNYRRIGVELFNMDGELKGSIIPEYFLLYKLVDDANEKWSKMTKSEKYDFLVELSSISEHTKFLMPQELRLTLRDLQQK